MAKKDSKVDPLFVKSKVREYIKGNECNTSSGVLDGDTFNEIIMSILDKAIRRAKGNNRKTVKARDL
jgi:histone H3/H4